MPAGLPQVPAALLVRRTAWHERWLIGGWQRAWRLLSVRAALGLVLLSVLQAQVLPLIEFAVPPRAWAFVTAGFGVAIVLCRLLAQGGVLAPPVGVPLGAPIGVPLDGGATAGAPEPVPTPNRGATP